MTKSITLNKTAAASDVAALRAVCSALSKDKTRTTLTHLLIQDNTAVATDGHRVHLAKLAGDYEDGLYQVIKSTKSEFIAIATEGLDYPEYKRVIPAKETCGEEVTLGTEIHRALATCLRALPENRYVNIDYFKDALAMFPDGCTLMANDIALRMEDTGGRLAVIALMCIEE